MELLQKREFNFWLNIISPIISIAVAWAVLSTTVASQQKQIDALERTVGEHRTDDLRRFEEVSGTYTEIQIRLAEIQRDIVYIKEKIR